MSLFIKTLTGENQGENRPPVWFMRQAGRALKSYRDLKAQHSFSELLYTPELASQVTRLPETDLGVDALILFSDILVLLEGMGVTVDYKDGGPKIMNPLRETNGKFQVNPQENRFDLVYETVKRVKKDSELPLIGFCGGPLTVFLYLFQGSGHNGNFDDALRFFYNHSEETDRILDQITEVSIQYALGQIKHGVDAFQIFETWSGCIPQSFYFERVMPRVRRIAEEVAKSVPVIFFPRIFSTGYLELAGEKNLSGISIDFITRMDSVLPGLNQYALQGNLDPHLIKYSDEETLDRYLDNYLEFYKRHPRWIVNLGHGVLPQTPEATLKFVVDKIKASKT